MFLHPLGLLALAGVPAIVALHLYRRRYQPRVVSAVFLWHAEDRTPAAGRKREPLRRSASFWCELLAAACLGLAFAGPRPTGVSEARHLVVVLDRSASLGAAGDGWSTRERAVEATKARIEALPRGSRVTLIGSGARPTVLAGPAALPLEALERLASFAPGLAHHELGPALALAFELAGGRAVTLVTDRFEGDSTPPEVELVAVGRAAPNVGLVAASRRRGATDGAPSERVSLTVANLSAFDAARTLRLETLAGAPLATKAVVLAGGAESHVSFDLPDDAPLLVARLTAADAAAPPDALAADDVAWLAPAPRRTLRLASTLPPELAAALGVDAPPSGSNPALASNIDRWLALVPDAVDTIHPAAAHLVLAPGLDEALTGPSAWVLAVAAPGEAREHFVGPFLTDPAHPLLAGVTLEGVVWAAAAEGALTGAPFISAGALPLAAEVALGTRRAWLLNLDPSRSTLQRSPDWPILLTNAAEARRDALPGARATSLALGEPLRYRVEAPATLRWRRSPAEGAGKGTVEGPVEGRVEGDGEGAAALLEVRDTLVLDDIAHAGVYELAEVAADGSEALLATVGVSLADRTESDLRDRGAGERAATADEATVRAGFTWVEVLLLLLALAALALDWWSLRRPAPVVAKEARP